MTGEPSPGTEVAAPAGVIDQADQVGIDACIDRVKSRDGGKHLSWQQRGEPLVGIQPGVQHRLAVQHLVAAVAADEQQREPGVGVVVQVTQVLEAFPVQPLRLIDDDQPELR